ncbi:MAG TPA: hypothetical protein VIK53_13805 [Verrucomicrobiae bacterium]
MSGGRLTGLRREIAATECNAQLERRTRRGSQTEVDFPFKPAPPGTKIEIEIRGRRFAAVVVKKPIYQKN